MKLTFTIRQVNTLTTISWDSTRSKTRGNRRYKVDSTFGWMVRTRTRQFGRIGVQRTLRNPEALKTRNTWATPSHFDSSYALRHEPREL